MKHWGIIVLLLMLLSGCGQVKETSESVDVVVAALAEVGYQVVAVQIESQIFTGDCYRLSLEGEESALVTVYEYDTEEQAACEAGGIDESGFGIKYINENGQTYVAQVDWVSKPHFFIFRNLIVQYIGTDNTVLQKLQELCGLQIAGAAMVEAQ